MIDERMSAPSRAIRAAWGCADRLPDAAGRLTRIEGRFRTVVEAWGYDEVSTSIVERCDAMRAGWIDSDWFIQSLGPNGEMGALRPDLTAPIARLVATRLRDAPNPLRLFYADSVYRRPERSGGGSIETRQAGIELIGCPSEIADAEAVAAAIEALAAVGLDGFQLHLGQIGFFEGLVEEAGLAVDEVRAIREQIDRKDRDGLSRVLAACNLPGAKARQLDRMLTLIGGDEVIDRALDLADNDRSEAAARNLKAIIETLAAFGVADNVVVDLTEVRGFGYYTGLMVEAYVPVAGAAILRGGRYDDLVNRFGDPRPAVGWAFDLDRILPLVAGDADLAPPRTDLLVRFDTANRGRAYRAARRLRRRGRRVELEVARRTEAESLAYARQKGIRAVIEVGANGVRRLPNRAPTGQVKEGCAA